MAKGHEEKSCEVTWCVQPGKKETGEAPVCHNRIHKQSRLCSVLQNHVKMSLD